MPTYMSLIRVAGNNVGQLAKNLKNLKSTGQTKVLGTWTSFGLYDGEVLFSAPTEAEAMDFVAEHIRSIEGVNTTETYSVIPQAPNTPQAS